MLTNYTVLAEYFFESNIQCKFSKYRLKNSVLTCYIFHDIIEMKNSSRMKNYYLLQIVNVENESCNDNTKTKFIIWKVKFSNTDARMLSF